MMKIKKIFEAFGSLAEVFRNAVENLLIALGMKENIYYKENRPDSLPKSETKRYSKKTPWKGKKIYGKDKILSIDGRDVYERIGDKHKISEKDFFRPGGIHL